jgi:riboflavin synthase alpha subunit
MLLITPKSLRSQVLNIGKNIAGHKRLGGKSVQGDYMETVHVLQRKVPTAEGKL